MVKYVDAHRGIDALPLNRREAEKRWPVENYDVLRDAQDRIVEQWGYRDYRDRYLARDPWFSAHGITPQGMADAMRYSRLLAEASGHGVPVMTLVAADDYILTPENVAAFRALESSPRSDQATKVFAHGGHTGLLFQPEVRDAMGDFLRE